MFISSQLLSIFFYFRIFYIRNGDFASGGPIDPITEEIMYLPLDDDLTEEINRRINEDNVFELAGLSLSSSTQTTTTPSEQPTNASTVSPPVNTNSSRTLSDQEPFITSSTGFAAIAGAVVACLALITCSIIACVYLRVKQLVHEQKSRRFVNYYY